MQIKEARQEKLGWELVGYNEVLIYIHTLDDGVTVAYDHYAARTEERGEQDVTADVRN